MNTIRIKCPAKINLTLEILNKREDGFHNIKSIMQLINLYDYLNLTVEKSNKFEIQLSGTSNEIPYNEKNLVYKAIDLFFQESKLGGYKIQVHIEKNIPIAAGLAGGSTDAAGVIWGLNYILKIFDDKKLNELCAKLGSDLNVCLNGGCVLATSRGEIIEKLPNIDSEVTLIKPKDLGISAGEAYKKYAAKKLKPQNFMTEKMLEAINKKEKIGKFLYNDLEYAIFDDYFQLQEIKKAYPNSIMSGSGSTYFLLENIKENLLDNNFEFFTGLNFIHTGVSLDI